ncbi:hypothetical protein CEJ45_18495 [Herbaspirillum aquaticum]|uniref:Uncharacterized protein n=1 Tax=Herbaspirillum aquaticum TaxID=568783 RepID=A0A225SPX5_9BURK|nr:hypothetical protein CEJ45_18495 [Herbaspirillum aquaticum]
MASKLKPAAARQAAIPSRTPRWIGSKWACSLMADDLGRKRAGTSGMERLLVATSRQKMQAGKSRQALAKF